MPSFFFLNLANPIFRSHHQGDWVNRTEILEWQGTLIASGLLGGLHQSFIQISAGDLPRNGWEAHCPIRTLLHSSQRAQPKQSWLGTRQEAAEEEAQLHVTSPAASSSLP